MKAGTIPDMLLGAGRRSAGAIGSNSREVKAAMEASKAAIGEDDEARVIRASKEQADVDKALRESKEAAESNLLNKVMQTSLGEQGGDGGKKGEGEAEVEDGKVAGGKKTTKKKRKMEKDAGANVSDGDGDGDAGSGGDGETAAEKKKRKKTAEKAEKTEKTEKKRKKSKKKESIVNYSDSEGGEEDGETLGGFIVGREADGAGDESEEERGGGPKTPSKRRKKQKGGAGGASGGAKEGTPVVDLVDSD